jgi:hypothetical protein
MHRFFPVFSGKKDNFQGKFIFLYIQNIGHLLLHTLPIYQVSYEYLARKPVFLLQQTIH